MNIEVWLDKFRDAWVDRDIATVMSLFTDDVTYWETPHKLIGSKRELADEWEPVKLQQDIRITTKVFNSSLDNKHAVIWHLIYVRDGETREFGGTYLIGLNDNGLCDFFHHTGEEVRL